MKLFLSFFFAGCSFIAYTQSSSVTVSETELAVIRKKMDSLDYFIESGKAIPSFKVCRIPAHMDYSMRNTSFYFSKEALHAQGKLKEALVHIYALSGIAAAAYEQKEYATYLRCMQECLDIARINNLYYDDLHRIRPSLNNIYFYSGEYSGAMKVSAEGLALSQQLKDTNRILHFSNVIGYIHLKQKNYPLAGQYFSQEEHLARAIKDTIAIAKALLNRADLLIAQSRYDTAITLLQQSLEGYRSCDSINAFSLIDREAFIANKMAEAAKLKGDNRAALRHVLTATSICRLHPAMLNDYDEAGTLINAGDIYNRLRMPDSAIIFLRTGLATAERIIHKEYIRDALEQLAVSFAQKKMYDSAWLYQTAFSKLKDSISNVTNEQEIMQRELALKIQQQDILQKAALEKQKLWRNIIAGIALFSLVIVGFLYNRYRLRQKNRYQQQLNRQRNELFNVIAATQDQERKRIARDIHDSLGSVLSAAKLKLSSVKERQPSLPEEQMEIIQVTMRLLDEASAELRNISHNIMPATLSKLGLIAALRNLVNTISSNSGLQVDFSAHGFSGRLDEQTEMSVYRIVLELINNIVKHAQAEKATIQLVKHTGYINLSVEDNGRGFEYEPGVQQNSGIGLANIVSRVEYLEGKINVDAAAGRGTAVIIDIPCNSG